MRDAALIRVLAGDHRLTEQTAADPTAFAVSCSTWAVAYRTDLDIPRLRRYQPTALADTGFLDIPITRPGP